jgi:hypothetical protein
VTATVDLVAVVVVTTADVVTAAAVVVVVRAVVYVVGVDVVIADVSVRGGVVPAAAQELSGTAAKTTRVSNIRFIFSLLYGLSAINGKASISLLYHKDA